MEYYSGSVFHTICAYTGEAQYVSLCFCLFSHSSQSISLTCIFHLLSFLAPYNLSVSFRHQLTLMTSRATFLTLSSICCIPRQTFNGGCPNLSLQHPSFLPLHLFLFLFPFSSSTSLSITPPSVSFSHSLFLYFFLPLSPSHSSYFYISLSPYFYLFRPLYFCSLSLTLSIALSLCPVISLFLSFLLSHSLSISASLCPHLFPSLPHPLSLSLTLSLFLPFSLSLSPPFSLFLSVSLPDSYHPSLPTLWHSSHFACLSPNISPRLSSFFRLPILVSHSHSFTIWVASALAVHFYGCPAPRPCLFTGLHM